MRHQSNSYVLYYGPSMLDGSPIVVIATGFRGTSVNEKTGRNLISIWILCADLHPLDALLTEADAAICGHCSLRGIATPEKMVDRKCFVIVGHAPYNIWRQWNRERPTSLSTRRIGTIFADRGVRFGAYGDPAAVPLPIWRAVSRAAKFCIGYTHQWRTCHPTFSRWCMASCDSEADRIEAKALGYRTYRVTRLNSWSDRQAGETVCPASKEAGKKSTCELCRACSGTDGRGLTDVVITMHGFDFQKGRRSSPH